MTKPMKPTTSAISDLITAAKAVIPHWFDDFCEQEAKYHNGSIAGEITYGEVRAIKAAVRKLEQEGDYEEHF